jgi:beta-phosphoglucomutase family hydrolase
VPDQGGASSLGLPAAVRGCLFDLDGVLTRTASTHQAAWAAMFDEFLAARARGDDFCHFSSDDYEQYLDGKPRTDGTRSFLASRDISLPEGSPDDAPGTPTVYGLGKRKNELFLQQLATRGVEIFDGSIRYVRAARAAGLSTAVVSSSANAAQVLDAGRIADLFDARVDGEVAQRCRLKGKPAPDTFLAGAAALHVDADEAAVFEDALAGVEAGRAGCFAFVVGVDRAGHAEALREHGADVVVDDLSELMDTP